MSEAVTKDKRPAQVQAAPAPESGAATKRIDLALQGGGSHGAFTWGVVDRLLEDGRIDVEGVVGTSAGAMNATVTAYGLAVGGREGAREALGTFWRRISKEAAKGPLQPTWLDKAISPGNMDFSPLWNFFDALSRLFSPYQLNPMNLNPLRDVLTDVVDFDALRRSTSVKLFISATNVMNGRLRVFETHEISPEVVLASACLPFMFQAVEIDGGHYWDGGYMGNPPIYPLIYGTKTNDVLIVQINPINIEEPPRTAQEILDRINTLSFNSSLMREMRAIHFVSQLIDDGMVPPDKFKRVYVHTIEAEEFMRKLGVSSKLNADWDFLQTLFKLGRERADTFLKQHFDKIGKQSSTDIARDFL